jgi:lipid A 4'-phosphatase
VNIILKENWGRVRPTGIEAFGGPHPYTPPFQIPGACAENCSFVSGEGSGSMATALVFVAIAAHLPRPAALLLIGFGAAVAVVGGGLRVAMGGHFLSDVLIGAILTYILAEALARPILGAPLGYRAASPRQPAPTATI